VSKRAWCCSNKHLGCPTTSLAMTTTSFPWDCQAGRQNWEVGWSQAKKSYCCVAFEFGCDPFDCSAGVPEGWSAEKQAWCCEKKRLGCTTTDGPVQFDCQAGLSNWESGWNDAKKQFCCHKTGQGCDPFDCAEGVVTAWSITKAAWCCDNGELGCPSTTTIAYDCNAGLQNWEKGWSPGKKEFCCEKTGAACKPYDCQEGLSNAEHGWSESKILWCCDKEGLGCPTTTTVQYDCMAGAGNWQKAWSEAKKGFCCNGGGAVCDPYDCTAGIPNGWSSGKQHWCCEHKDLGCTTTDGPTAFDCKAGADNWEAGWNEEKKAFCCGSGQAECMPYNCDSGWGNAGAGWSLEKTAWCCRNEKKGCPTTTVITYDCNAGLSSWEAGWSPGKKEYCCERTGTGCDAYDCNEGSEDVWPIAKKAYCCDHSALGCPTTTTLPFNCLSGAASWEKSWNQAKKDFCCSHGGAACDPYDCTAGIPNGWSIGKLEWCCKNKEVGCTTTDGPVQFDCEAGAANWEAGWNEQKKDYCCKMGGAKCEKYDCQEGLNNWQNAWPLDKVDWCCTNKGLACAPATTRMPFDCNAGLSRYESLWSDKKREFCCSTRQLGCDKYDCNQGPVDMWCEERTQWCCEHKNLGCDANNQVAVAAVMAKDDDTPEAKDVNRQTASANDSWNWFRAASISGIAFTVVGAASWSRSRVRGDAVAISFADDLLAGTTYEHVPRVSYVQGAEWHSSVGVSDEETQSVF